MSERRAQKKQQKLEREQADYPSSDEEHKGAGSTNHTMGMNVEEFIARKLGQAMTDLPASNHSQEDNQYEEDE